MTTAKKNQGLDIIIVGAGFSGIYMLHCAREAGFSAKVVEAGSGIGGTWFWNRYPGARCDAPSMEYSYQFDKQLQQDWTWSEKYSSQAEILSYMEHVVERFNLADGIQLNTRIASAAYDEDHCSWKLLSTEGEQFSAKFCIFATGCLSNASRPVFENESAFEGAIYHTGEWPHEEVDFSGQKVAVIGTGSSGIQSITAIAKQAKELTVFQRTPAFSVPSHNRPFHEGEQEEIKAHYDDLRASARSQFGNMEFEPNERCAGEMSEEEIQQELEHRWELGGLKWYGVFADFLLDKEANDIAANFVRKKIREIVKDSATAEKLLPATIFGCKRVVTDTGYYETFNRENVELVDISSTPIEGYTEKGLLVGGKEYEFDVVVLATGYDAMTGALLQMDILGRGGQTLKDKWQAGPVNYLGLQVAGFPNMFMVTGPGSPSVLSNMMPSIELHVEYIRDTLVYLRDKQKNSIEAKSEAEESWVSHVNEAAEASLLLGCNSWYLGANIPGKPRVFMPYLGCPPYEEKIREVANSGYSGFELKD